MPLMCRAIVDRRMKVILVVAVVVVVSTLLFFSYGGEHLAGRPAVTKEGSGRPAVTKEGSGRPAVTKEGSGRPAVTKEGSRLPAVTKEGSGWPAVTKEGSGQPAVTKEGSGRPAMTKEGSGQPAVTKEGSGQPAVTKEGSGQPAVTKQLTSRLQAPVKKNVNICKRWRDKYFEGPPHEREEWWDKLCFMERELESLDYHCKDKRKMGNRLACFDNGVMNTNSCIVYSFGIDFDFRFDDAFAKIGCTVYSFDPSMNVKDHKHSERVFFKAVGLSDVDDDLFIPRHQRYVKTADPWPMRRLSTIMKELGHEKGSITLLKMDIEAYEWEAMADILSNEGLVESIPQVFVEWHLFDDYPPRDRYDKYLSTYFRFKATGLKKFFTGVEGKNHTLEGLKTQAETGWVNPRFFKPQGVKATVGGKPV